MRIRGDTLSREEWTAILVDQPRLLVTCWCERYVVKVLRTDVLDGRTWSCGLDDCCSPTGHRGGAELGVWSLNSGAAAYQVRRPTTRIRVPRRQQHRDGTSRGRPRKEEAERRELIAQLWREGKNEQAIARRIGQPRWSVINDLAWLASKGRLS